MNVTLGLRLWNLELLNTNLGLHVKIKLDLSNYVSKYDLKRAIGNNACNVAANLDLDIIKAEVDQIVKDKQVTSPCWFK